MDIRKILVKGHSKSITRKIADYVGVSPTRINSLIQVYLSGPFRITQRASWPLSVCAERHPKLIYPHLKTLLGFVKKPDVHDAVKRNTVRLLQYLDIPKKYQGKVLDVCFEFLLDKKQAIAVRVFSMSVIAKLAEHEPDIQKELVILIEDEMPYASPAFRSRAKKILKGISDSKK